MSRWFLYIFFYSLAGYGLEKVFARAVRSERSEEHTSELQSRTWSALGRLRV